MLCLFEGIYCSRKIKETWYEDNYMFICKDLREKERKEYGDFLIFVSLLIWNDLRVI